ncbi:MAG TPA: phosphatase domain-containing protein [Thermomicrobiales bacterium]|nr:phosphatase domain-containing protein [Thermomicrobiales bacterium]
MDPDPTPADIQIERIEALLSGLTLAGDEREIVAILRDATPDDFNEILGRLDLERLLAKVDDHLFGSDNFTALIHLLTVRVPEMHLNVKARVVNALQLGRTKRVEEELVHAVLLDTHGGDLSDLKNAIDRSGTHHDMEKLVFSDIDTRPLRDDILGHIAREAATISPRTWKVLSDIDDTVFARLHDHRYPAKTVYPGVLAFLEELDRGPGMVPDETGDLTFVTARPTAIGGFIEGQTRQTLIRAGIPPSTILTGSLFALTSHARMAGRKLEMFSRYRLLFPEYDFIFIGDNGQGDAEFGRRMLEMAPDEVAAIFIHDVTGAEHRATTTWEEDGLIYFDTYIGAAIEAWQKGLITREGVNRVATETQAALAAIPFRHEEDREKVHSDHALDLQRVSMLPETRPA